MIAFKYTHESLAFLCNPSLGSSASKSYIAAHLGQRNKLELFAGYLLRREWQRGFVPPITNKKHKRAGKFRRLALAIKHSPARS
jgi:hypothetical protein